jgi:hypothetical protein
MSDDEKAKLPAWKSVEGFENRVHSSRRHFVDLGMRPKVIRRWSPWDKHPNINRAERTVMGLGPPPKLPGEEKWPVAKSREPVPSEQPDEAEQRAQAQAREQENDFEVIVAFWNDKFADLAPHFRFGHDKRNIYLWKKRVVREQTHYNVVTTVWRTLLEIPKTDNDSFLEIVRAAVGPVLKGSPTRIVQADQSVVDAIYERWQRLKNVRIKAKQKFRGGTKAELAKRAAIAEALNQRRQFRKEIEGKTVSLIEQMRKDPRLDARDNVISVYRWAASGLPSPVLNGHYWTPPIKPQKDAYTRAAETKREKRSVLKTVK